MRMSDYRAMLPTSKHTLDDQLEVHAEHADGIAQEAARAARAEAEAKDRLAVLEARLGAQFRRDAEKSTVAEIAGLVLRDADRADRFREYQQASQELAEWRSLQAAWKDKGYAIKALAELHHDGYFAVRSAGARRGAEPDHGARAAMREARESGAPVRRRAE